MVQQKRSEYWTSRIDSERLQPYRLWKSFDQILGRGQIKTVSDISASVLHRFFDNKVAGVRHRHNSALLPLAVSFGVFNQSRHPTLWTWSRRYLKSSAHQTLSRRGC